MVQTTHRTGLATRSQSDDSHPQGRRTNSGGRSPLHSNHWDKTRATARGGSRIGTRTTLSRAGDQANLESVIWHRFGSGFDLVFIPICLAVPLNEHPEKFTGTWQPSLI